MAVIIWQSDNYSGEILEAEVLIQILNLIFFQRSCCLPVFHFSSFWAWSASHFWVDAMLFREQLGSGWRRKWHPTPVLLPGKSHGWRSLVGCSPRGHEELDTTEQLHFHFTFMHWRRKWQPTPVFLPGESQERGSLVGCRLWGRTESDTTEVT